MDARSHQTAGADRSCTGIAKPITCAININSESDYGLDLLGSIVDRQLKALDFLTFKVVNALEIIKADIMEEIRQVNRGCSTTDLISYFSENFPYSFDPVEHHVKEFVVTAADLTTADGRTVKRPNPKALAVSILVSG